MFIANLETDLGRGPWFEFPGRRHHGAGRPFVALDDPQDSAHQATIASGSGSRTPNHWQSLQPVFRIIFSNDGALSFERVGGPILVPHMSWSDQVRTVRRTRQYSLPSVEHGAAVRGLSSLIS